MKESSLSIWSTSSITEIVVIVTNNSVHIVGQELLFFFGVHHESLYGEFFITVHTAHKLTVLISLWTGPAGNGPRLEKAEFLSAVGTLESMRG